MDGLTYFLPCIYAFFACIGFSLLFNIHGAGMFICAGGGALGWLCYLLAAPLVQSDIVQSFLAALVISAWSEVMARLRRTRRSIRTARSTPATKPRPPQAALMPEPSPDPAQAK